MKTPLILCCFFLSSTLAFSAQSAPAPASQPGAPEQAELTPQAILAAQVSEIASDTTMSRAAQEKLIASAVRLAIATAIEGIKDRAQALKIAVQLTTAAAKAAPRFGETIMLTASSIPALAGIDGALGQIQAAVLSGIKATGSDGLNLAPPGGSPPAPSPEFGGNSGDVKVSPSH